MTGVAREHVAAVVLGGGRSARFGSDKLAIDVGGAPLLLHAVDAARGVARQVVVVGRPAVPLPEGVVVVADSQPHAGPYAAVLDGIDALGLDAYHRAAYALLDGLHVAEVQVADVPGAGSATRDVDTPADLP